MKTDAWTKLMLTIIAVMLSTIALRPFLAPYTVAMARSQQLPEIPLQPLRPVGPPKAGSKALPGTKTWEYQIYDVTRDGYLGFTDPSGELQSLGEDGWELVSVMPVSNYYGKDAGFTSEMMFIFKRPL